MGVGGRHIVDHAVPIDNAVHANRPRTLPRELRSELRSTLVELAAPITAAGGRLSLLTLEADHVLPWLTPPPLPDDASADERHASILAATTFHPSPGNRTQVCI